VVTPLTKGSPSCVVQSAAPTLTAIPRSIVLVVRGRYVVPIIIIGGKCCYFIIRGCFIWHCLPLIPFFHYCSPHIVPSSSSYTSRQAGICCCNLECCCKFGAPCLFPCCCVGIRPECDGCSFINAQCQACCVVASIALPCNKEVPVAISVAGLTIFPTCGCCIRQKEIMNR
jgi:hypothetical protein